MKKFLTLKDVCILLDGVIQTNEHYQKKKKKKMTGLSAYPFWANFWLCSKVFAFMHIAAFNFV